MPISVLFEDDDILVINKPNNILIHSSYYARNIKSTPLIDILEEEKEMKLYIVHRLDYKTSGVLLIAKSSANAAALQQQFEANKVEKIYTALVRGFTPEAGMVDTPIKNADTGKYRPALTTYKTLESFEVAIAVQPYPQSRYSLVKLFPKTGRMHQLRKHMNKISHPIIGDHRYGNRHHNKMYEDRLNCPEMFLHATSITFKHPVKKEQLTIIAPFPAFWDKAKKLLKEAAV